MKPDPTRQWFVYFQEKELGPFLEPDILSKLRSGELDARAYVFSEGMTDWSLVHDVDLFKARENPPLPAAPPPTPRSISEGLTPAPGPIPSAAAPMQGGVRILKEQTASGLKTQIGASPALSPSATAAISSQKLTPAPTLQPSAARPGSPIVNAVQPKAAAPRTAPAPTENTISGAKTQIGKAELPPSRPASTVPSFESPHPVAQPGSQVREMLDQIPPSFNPAGQGMKDLSIPGIQMPPATHAVSAAPAPKKKKTPGAQLDLKIQFQRFRPLLKVLTIVLIAAAALSYLHKKGAISSLMGLLNGSRNEEIPNPEEISGVPKIPSTSEEAENEAPKAAPPPSKATGPAMGSATTAPEAVDWNELLALRNSKNTQGPPYRLASRTLGQRRPVILGALSQFIRADHLSLAIFPDNDRTFMAIPKLWIMKVAVLDGYFAAGPMNVDGGELPIGKYKVVVEARVNNKPQVLGDTAFEIGPWPSGSKLNEMQTATQNERNSLAEKERSALEIKIREVNAALDQLKTSSRFATQGPKASKEWHRVSRPWTEAMTKAKADQVSVLSGPMFYGSTQYNLFTFMDNILNLRESLGIVSAGGVKALQKARKTGLGQLWSEITDEQTKLTSEIKSLSQKPVSALRIDPEIVKQQLLNADAAEKTTGQ